MSETTPLNQSNFRELQEQTNTRRANLEPALAQLAIKAKIAYTSLRPQAKHVSEVDLEFPLRHQQVRGLSGGGPGGVVADYLMINLGYHHNLTLYQYYNSIRAFKWQFERYMLLDDLMSQRTKVEELAQPRLKAYGGGVMDIASVTFKYPEKVGQNGQYINGVCNSLNNYQAAESLINEFVIDLDESIRRF